MGFSELQELAADYQGETELGLEGRDRNDQWKREDGSSLTSFIFGLCQCLFLPTSLMFYNDH